ncbi:hypothetical protein L3073_02550 [Ancylomarina sp. DW003]|nr:hypothetical protein [Ancylomarina sp. DW003]MDE5421081.1 hypothetical protein [Ancylomarina sp. DW003]
MKTILLLLIGFIPSLVFGQHIDVPKKVTKTFEEKFQDVEDLSWNTKNDNFEASFYLNDIYTLSLYTKQGVWLETASATNPYEIPTGLVDKIYNTYSESEIERIFDVETFKNTHFFRIELTDEKTHYLITVTHKGVITEISKTALNNYDEELE